MIKNGIIDLNKINPNFEVPLNSLINRNENTTDLNSDKLEKNGIVDNKFVFEEIEVNDSSASIYYTQFNNKILVNVYGPRETRYREKMKNDEAIIEIYTKFNYEVAKEKNRKLNALIQNFCESLIFLDTYPRCQINLCINVISSLDEKFLTTTILNGIMLALCISGIDLKTFALSSSFVDNNLEMIISLDANKPDNILLIESNMPLKLHLYQYYLGQSKSEVMDLYQKYKKVLLKRLV